MKPEDVSVELIQIAADALQAVDGQRPCGDVFEQDMRIILAAVLPIYERQIQQTIAANLWADHALSPVEIGTIIQEILNPG